jgi:hypothetical protein
MVRRVGYSLDLKISFKLLPRGLVTEVTVKYLVVEYRQKSNSSQL